MSHPAFRRIDHRPWPPPRRPWIMQQSWLDVLAVHWSVERELLEKVVPRPLALQMHDGSAWLSVIGLRLSGLRVRDLPPVPGFSEFQQMNVRVYVQYEGRPGIYFLSVDATSRFAVSSARTLFQLPYAFATGSMERRGDWGCFACTRPKDQVAFRTQYWITSEPREPRPGSLEHFLMERYCQYAICRGRVLSTEVHHQPWALRNVDVKIQENTVLASRGLELDPFAFSSAQFSERVDAVMWNPSVPGGFTFDLQKFSRLSSND